MPDEEPRVHLTREWLVKAYEDLDGATRLATAPPIAASAVFHCQQAAEKALKGFLSWHDRPFSKTHVLGELIDQCRELDGGFSNLDASAASLTPYAWAYRYPGRSEPSPDDLETALRHAREVVAFVLERLPPEVHP